ncbi:Sulfate adenylyltransferase (ADP) protein [Dioscorea alata]|uniref:Sulfate adenylyltransferase (ADP) protein n=2 Tax=Dioscorea alata TaxID=55571 RepID=A0ACB7U5U4_DIOAL|nr:Sulfate adenylyltransferase (ADP) protein [Dioscorea alata]KAH7655641.1 Sulfate adenylyltransferase (ADP) protein [Dioscorea alata]
MKKKSTEKRSRGQIRKRGGCCGWLSIGSEIRESEILGSDIRHYLVIPVEHVATVNDLKSGVDDHQLVSHMLNVGQNLLSRDALESKLCSLSCFLDCIDSVSMKLS